MSTISTTITHTVTLGTSGSYASPLTITATGAVETSTGLAVYGPVSNAGTIINQGTIAETGSGFGIGVYLRDSGVVTNAAGATISGTKYGVRIDSSGTYTGDVFNFGTIVGGVDVTGNGAVVNGTVGGTVALISGNLDIGVTGSIDNYGSIAGSIYLGGGSVTNGSSGAGRSITGTAGLGVEIGVRAAGTVSNFGTIAETGSGFGIGVYLRDSGVVTNAVGATISGTKYGVRIDSSGSYTGDVFNFGTIAGGVDVTGNGAVVNGTIGGTVALISGNLDIGVTGSIDNYGSIAGSIYLGGGSVTNGSGGAGRSIISTTGLGVEIGVRAAGTVSNFGTIAETGTGFGIGVYLRDSGVATNAAGALISGTKYGVRIDSSGSYTGDVFNVGTIAGGVDVTGNGAVVNGTVGGAIYLITGNVDIGGTGLIDNYGSVAGSVYLGGGSVTNGSSGAGRSITGTTGLGVEIGVRAAGTVANFGTIAETGSGLGIGVYLRDSGVVTNAVGALISGTKYGVRIDSSGSYTGDVFNFSTIAGGVDVTGNGAVVNGTIGGTVALISGNLDIGGTGSIGNYGSIAGSIYLGGGSVTNGSSGAGRSITGTTGLGVEIGVRAAGAVANFGTIAETGSGFGIGVYLRDSGVATNAVGALISGTKYGVRIDSSGSYTGTVFNFGTIAGGVDITGNGAVFNGTVGGSAALIVGGVTIGGTGLIDNYGSIAGSVYLGGGSVTNGSSGAGRSIISTSGLGVETGVRAAGTVSNFGTIAETGSGIGVYLRAGGLVTNAAGATISGTKYGVRIDSSGSYTGTVRNFGTIAGGVDVIQGSGINYGTVTVGANGVGIDLLRGDVTNFGTIIAPGTLAKAVVVRYGMFFNEGALTGSVFGIELGVTPTGTGTTTATASGQVIAAGTVTGATGIGAAPGVTAGYTVTVAGTVIGTSGPAVSLTPGGNNRLILHPGALFQGLVDGGLGGTSVLEIAAGALAGQSGPGGGQGGVAYVNLGSVTNFSALQIDPSATLDGSGALSFGTLVNAGQVNVGSGDSLALGTVVAAASTGIIDLRTGGMVRFMGPVAGQTVVFNPAGGIAAIDQAGAFGATVTDFAVADTIDLTGFVVAGKSFANNALMLTDTVGNTATLDIVGSFSTGSFHTAPDGGAGTNITIACYCRGTLILTERGEVAVEELAIGDRVVTLSGLARPVKWIGRRSYDGRFAFGQRHILPVCVKAGALGDGVPRRDLWLSPNHALYLEGVLIEARDLVNRISVFQAERVAAIDYFHIELDTHDVILAEGAAAESFVDDDSRGLFHNAYEYRALYRDAATGPGRYCAPRRDQGCEVERARAAIARRAGLAAAAEAPPPGELRGRIDAVGRRRICGWAQDMAHPEAAVCLDIYAGGELIGQVVANRHRADLAAAGLGSGRHGFEFVPPPGLALIPGAIEVRRSLDGARLASTAQVERRPARQPRSLCLPHVPARR